MNTPSKHQQYEFDVFPKSDKSGYSYLSEISNNTNREAQSINVVFSHQSVIILFLCIVMLLVASFALGVEKGKLIARNKEIPEKQEAAAAVANSPITGTSVASGSAATKPQESIAAMPAINTLTPAAKPAGQSTTATAQETRQPQSGFTVQVASLKSETAAKTLADSLSKKGINAFTRSSGKYTIVLAGTFSKKEDAQANLKILKKTYTDCYIRNI
jgi:cell division septation protein DedD